MISGTIILTCDKCGATFRRDFESIVEVPAEVPSRDALLSESGYKTAWVEREFILCVACATGWSTKSAELTKGFRDEAKAYLVEKS